VLAAESFGTIAGITAFTAVIGVSAVWATRVIGRWFKAALVDSVADGIRDITAPDIDALAQQVTRAINDLSTSIQSAIEELASINSSQHELVDGRLTTVEIRLTDVEARLIILEKRLGISIRSPESRTRATDSGEILITES
jgi:hypothetical protein